MGVGSGAGVMVDSSKGPRVKVRAQSVGFNGC